MHAAPARKEPEIMGQKERMTDEEGAGKEQGNLFAEVSQFGRVMVVHSAASDLHH